MKPGNWKNCDFKITDDPKDLHPVDQFFDRGFLKIANKVDPIHGDGPQF